MDLFEDQFFWGGLILFALIFIFTLVVVFQQRRIQRLSQPNYGFLGKPLAAAALSILMGAGLIGGVYLVSQDQTADFEARADLDIQVEIYRELIVETDRSARYTFEALPTLDGLLYGDDPGATWNVYWNFNQAGSTLPLVSESETGLNAQNPSGIEVELDRGSYSIFVTIDYRGEDAQQVTTVTEQLVI